MTSRTWKYDVFLSFRGPDTRKGITFDIHNRLNGSGITTFMDDPDLQVGDVISPTLIGAIQDSRFAIVVLSQNYASSSWCLDELQQICLSMEDKMILPIFYHVEPSDVRYQKGSFEEAFSKHEASARRGGETVKQWRAALRKVADISGWNTTDFKTHKELVDAIVEYLRVKVPPDAIESTGDFQAYEATTEAMDSVTKALRDDKITTVGVYGMGGVGKTSMVRHVAARSIRNGTFNHWIMVVVSQNRDLERIQDTLADLLGFELKEKTEAGRAARLHKEIMRREKLLIIVDDVWERTELSSIGIPNYKELQKCKSKVLLTTRRFNVCHAMKCGEKIALKVLSETDSWTLFMRNAGLVSFRSPAFEKTARMVAGECKGLPIALIAVARALGDKDFAEWKKAVVRLENAQYVNHNHEEDEENAFKCIRLSYDYLKNEDHKLCFLLCCLFPEDYDIRLDQLFNYAFGMGLLKVAETTIEEAREAGDSIVKYLIASSLLLDSNYKGRVKMHDVIRDTALNIAQSEEGHWFSVKAGCGLKNWPPRGLHEGSTAISLMRNKILKLPDKELVCTNLQILLLNKNADLCDIPKKFIQGLKELRVLDLSNTSISTLPQSFSLLTNLQTLHLDFCEKLVEISVVGTLNNLEILSMRECGFKELSEEIRHLSNLRILDVARSWEPFTIPSEVISQLHNVEELYLMYSGSRRQGEENNVDFGELASLPNLKILHVAIFDEKFIPDNVDVAPDWDYFSVSIFGRCTNSKHLSIGKTGYRNSRFLFLNGVTISTLPDWFINVTEKTEKLEYDCCNGMNDILVEYEHGRLHELKHLIVGGSVSDSDVYLKELMNLTRRVQSGPVFENLEELHLLQLIHLEELCVGELPPESLSNLKVLCMNHCFVVKSVSKFVQRLSNLEKLHLNRLNDLEYVFGSERFEPEQSKLGEMHLLYLKSLRSICNGPTPRSRFKNLKALTVYHCYLMENLFVNDVAQCLFLLQDLYVECCPLLERVMEAVRNENMVLPNLKNLVLRQLPMLYIDATVDMKCPSLERLVVWDCPNIPFSVFSDAFGSFKSTNQLSYSTPAFDYFGSLKPVQLNDMELYKRLRDRLEI